MVGQLEWDLKILKVVIEAEEESVTTCNKEIEAVLAKKKSRRTINLEPGKNRDGFE